jgi:hypothetical protein
MNICQLCEHPNYHWHIYCGKCSIAIAEPALTKKTIASYFSQEIFNFYKRNRSILERSGLYLIDARFANFQNDLIDFLSEELNFSKKFSTDPSEFDNFPGYIFAEVNTNQMGLEATSLSPNFNDLVLLLNHGLDVFLIRNDIDLIDPKIKALAIANYQIPRFAPHSLKKILNSNFEINVDENLNLDWCRHLIPEDLLVNAQVKKDPLDHIYKAMLRRIEKYQCPDALDLDELYAFGEAREWAKDWAKDVQEICNGSSSLKWDDLERGILLVGPHGMGKINFAKSIAKSANLHLFECPTEYLNISDNVQDYVKNCYREAKKLSPAILYIESGNLDISHLASIFDLFDANEPVFILVTRTDQEIPEILLGPKRIEQIFQIPLPTSRTLKKLYKKIIENHDHQLNESDLDQLSKISQGNVVTTFRAEQIVRSAKRQARRRGQPMVLDDLIDQIYQIPKGSQKLLSLDRIKETAYHEAGHAAMMLLSDKGFKNVTYLTVTPSDNFLGFVDAYRDENDVSRTRKELIDEIRITLGGRAAEEIYLGIDGISTGAESDLQRATLTALYMTTIWGLGVKSSLVWWIAELSTNNDLREEINNLLEEQYKITLEILRKNWALIEKLVEEVIQTEELTGNEMREIYQNYLIQNKIKI